MSTGESEWVDARTPVTPASWVPKGEIYITSGRPIQIRAHGSDGWQPLQIKDYSLQFDETETDAVEWDPTVFRSTVSESWTITVSRLEQRTWRRMFGLPNPSLIHNGKKPRR